MATSRSICSMFQGLKLGRGMLLCLPGLAAAIAMSPTAFAACGCQDGVEIWVTGNIPNFQVEGEGEGPAKSINVEMELDQEYYFTLSEDEGNPDCNSGAVNFECGIEYLAGAGGEWTKGKSFGVLATSGTYPIPSQFSLRLSKGESPTPDEDDSSESGDPSDPDAPSDPEVPEVPGTATDPSVDTTTGTVLPGGLKINIPLGKVGLGEGGIAPFISGGYLTCGGPIAPVLAKPTQIHYVGSVEVKGRPVASVWGPVRPPIVTYVTPDEYPQEKHAETPTRLFRVTGYNETPGEAATFATAANTYVREYARASADETAATTFASQPLSWWTISAVEDGVKVQRYYNGLLNSKTFVAEVATAITVDDGIRFSSTTLAPPAAAGGAYSLQIEKKHSGVAVSKRLRTFEIAGAKYKISQETEFPDPSGSTGLTTEYRYYPATAGTSAGKLWFVSRPSGAWEVYEYTGTGETVKYTPFGSEAVLNFSHTNPATLPLVPASGFSSSTAHIRRSLGNSEVAVTLASPASGVQLGSSGGTTNYQVTNTSTDAIPDGIPLRGASSSGTDTISYSDQIPSTSSDRWRADLPILSIAEDGRASYYEYQLSGSVFTITETTGFSREAEENENPTVGTQLFEVVENLSQQTVTVRGPEGITSRETYYHTGGGFSLARLEELIYQDGRYHHTLVDGVEVRRVEWPDPLTREEKDAEGRVTKSTFDAFGELLWTETAAGGGVPAVRTTYQTTGLTTTTRINGVISSVIVRDGLGRTVSSRDQKGTVTTYSYPNGGRDCQTKLSGDIDRLEQNYLDGSLMARSGIGWVNSYRSMEVDGSSFGYRETTSTGNPTGHTDRAEISQYDSLGRLVKFIEPSPTGNGRYIVRTNVYHSTTNQLVSVNVEEMNNTGTVTATLPGQCYFADIVSDPTNKVVALGGVSVSGEDFNNDGLLEFGTDRFTKSETSYIEINGVVYRKTLQHQYPDPTGNNPLTTDTRQSIGFIKVGSDSYSGVTTVIQPSTRTLTSTTVTTPGSATVVTTEDDSATTTSVDTRSTSINGYLQTVEKAGAAMNETYRYDTFGRLASFSDARGAVTLSYYDQRFQVASVTDQLKNTVSYAYYLPGEKNAGKLKTVTRPGNLVELTTYNDRGQTRAVTGSATYPRTFEYDDFGDQVTMETNGTETAVTRWIYYPATGLLWKKRYDDVHKTSWLFDFQYEYTPDAKIAKRTNGRGVVTDYSYNPVTRDLTNINYTGDSNLTPDVTFSNFDGFGRPHQVSETRTGGSGAVGTDSSTGLSDYTTTQTLAYQPHSGAVSISYDANHRWLKDITVAQEPDDIHGRPAGFKVVKGDQTELSKQIYAYDTLSRLQGVSSAELSAVISHLPGIDSLKGITVANGANVVHSRILEVDLLGRTTGVINKAGPNAGSLAAIATIGHQYDAAGRRETARRDDGTWWDYDYNDRSEVTGAIKRLGNDLVPGLSFGYVYDAMGNRITSSSGTGTGVSTRSYGQNALNQYTSLTHDGKVNVLARSDSGLTATVTNGTHNGTDQQGNFYGVRQTATSYSTNGKLVTTALQRTAGGTAQSIQTWVPPANMNLSQSYDADGNLKWDGRWDYVWDGENRLVSMTTATNAISGGAPSVTIKFAYDWMGRRIGKSVTQSGNTSHQSFIYDHWNPVAEWNRGTLSSSITASNLQRTHLWAPDIASSAKAGFGGKPDYQAAGGVAGLIFSTFHNGTVKDHFIPSYDANGNIIAWSDGGGVLLQRRDYDPFGNAVLVENLSAPETVAKLPTHGFSTKPQDAETGLYFYGYRYYDPVLGRWPSRDRIEEVGGANLYGFVGNDGVGKRDKLGKKITEYTIDVNALHSTVGPTGGGVNAYEEATWAYQGKCDLTTAAFWGLGTNESLTLSGNLDIKIVRNRFHEEDEPLEHPSIYNTLIEHERHHAKIDKTLFNSASKIANGYEGKYCKGCCEKAKELALAIMNYARTSSDLLNAEFDFSEYRKTVPNERIRAQLEADKDLVRKSKNFITGGCRKL